MPVFFVHDVNHGIVKPLDRKFRVREINPVQQVTEPQAIHSKESSDISSYQPIYPKSNTDKPDTGEKNTPESNQKAIQSYQENTPHSPKLSLGKVKEIMSQPIIQIFSDQTLETAWTIMQEHGIHHLIILDEQYQYCGLLSEKVITPYLMRFTRGEQNIKGPETETVSYFCNQNLLSTHPETELYDLGIAMLEYGLDAVAVSEGSKIIGIVTKSDIFKVIVKHQSFETLA